MQPPCEVRIRISMCRWGNWTLEKLSKLPKASLLELTNQNSKPCFSNLESLSLNHYTKIGDCEDFLWIMEGRLDTFFLTVLLDSYVLTPKDNWKIVLRFKYVIDSYVVHIKFKLYGFFSLDYSSHKTCQSNKLQEKVSVTPYPPSTTCPASH